MSDFLIEINEYKTTEERWEKEELERISKLFSEGMELINSVVQEHLTNREKAPWIIELDIRFQDIIERINENIRNKGFETSYEIIDIEMNEDKYIKLKIDLPIQNILK